MVKIAKPVSLRRLDLVNEGVRDAVLFRYATSWAIMMSRWVGMPPWVGFRPGRREQDPPTPQPGWERSAAKRFIPAAQSQE